MSTGPTTTLTLDVPWEGETVQVANIARQLPQEPTAEQQSAVLSAALSNPGIQLPDGAWAAIARATTHPDALAVQLRPTPSDPTGILMAENVEGATLRSAGTRVLTSELFPGIQPRTGMSVMEVPDPQVQGLTHDGQPSAIVEYRYESFAHLRDHMWQTINSTLSINSYAQSILTRSVTRNLIVHPVRITFEDGTDPVEVLVVRDGITRLASTWSVYAGPGEEPSTVATTATDALLGGISVASAQENGSDLGKRLADSRASWRAKLREEFDAEIKGEVPGPRAAQIFQSYAVPAQIAVGVDGHTGRLLSPEDLFDDAIRSVLASIHVEFRQWDTAAQNVEVITRALKRVIQIGDPRWSTSDLQDVYGLAVGRIPVADLPEVFGSTGRPPGTALWRAVYLVSALTKPDLLEALKDQAKAIKGGKRMAMKAFGGLLGPMIDLPWRSRKSLVTKTARNAWSNGGVLAAVVTGEWDPVPTDDFTTLVEPALLGDVNARCTLAVAGGVALIADKLLTRNVGSSLDAPKEKSGVPFRADTSVVIEGLSREGNELGLWTLATAANTFRADDLPLNSVTRQSLTGRETAESDEKPYAYFQVDLTAEDKIARTADGVPVLLYEWDVVAASDPDRVKKPVVPGPAPATQQAPSSSPSNEEGGSDADPDWIPEFEGQFPEDGTPASGAIPPPRTFDTPVPPSQRAAEHRKDLRLHVLAARDAMDRLLALEPEVGEHTPLAPLSTLDDLHKLLLGIQTDVENLRRRTPADDLGEDPYDVVDDEDTYAE
ncbi:hypothetical protein [Streptomyces flavochromogenes]|uniref:hypothetical protein n=1 Tax=Streptomyces flavochromogenes TaxID=68199 RepID=UPI000A98C8BB|nr:hypothetical protein [Streptomyces flavochromogenes]